jgi:formamidopyrimidine-DNA glycosylase
MPELPEVELYLHALRPRVEGRLLEHVRLRSPSLLRTWDPPLSAVEGRTVRGARRLGKRIVFELDGGLFLVIHLMIAGRFRWKPPGAKLPGRVGLAALDFADGTLLLVEAATKKRAQLHVLKGEDALAALDRGGVEPLDADLATFAAALRRENHTLKRALTDPRLLSGIGNAHSDEILHEARLSPLKRTAQLTEDEVARLYDVARRSLVEWTDRLRREASDVFPEKVTAFHPAMRVHGRHRQPCPACGTTIQRIVHGDHETNYCPTCQTGGRLLRDRALSKLLREDWPRTVEELEVGTDERRHAR